MLVKYCCKFGPGQAGGMTCDVKLDFLLLAMSRDDNELGRHILKQGSAWWHGDSDRGEQTGRTGADIGLGMHCGKIEQFVGNIRVILDEFEYLVIIQLIRSAKR